MNKDLPLLPYFLDQIGSPVGNYHHGIVDGTTLDDGAAGVAHPALVPYVQNARLWVTPCIDLAVPGHSFTAPPDPPAGVQWLDHAILSGVQHAMYQKNLMDVNPFLHVNRWFVSFGVGNTFACRLDSSVTLDAGGGSASVTLTLDPFGRFGLASDPPQVVLNSSALTPIGQPVAGSLAGDFPAVAGLKLMPFDISQDGQRAILGVVEADDNYHGFNAARGFILLEFTLSGITLTLLKSRADMLVSVNQVHNTGQTGGTYNPACTTTPTVVTTSALTITESREMTASNLVAAYFDAAGAVQFLRYDISSSYAVEKYRGSFTSTCQVCVSSLVDSCTIDDGQTIPVSATLSHTGTVNLVRLSDSVVMRSASFNNSASASGSITGGDLGNPSGSWSESYGGTTLGGTALSLTVSHPTEYNIGISKLYRDYFNSIHGSSSFTTYPVDFDALADVDGRPVSQIGLLGLVAHEIPFQGIETFAGLLRRGQYAALPLDGTDGMVICAHPRTGQIIHKLATYGSIPPPSYGFA